MPRSAPLASVVPPSVLVRDGAGAGARLFTSASQARGSYETRGYTVFGTPEDFPPGHGRIRLREALDG